MSKSSIIYPDNEINQQITKLTPGSTTSSLTPDQKFSQLMRSFDGATNVLIRSISDEEARTRYEISILAEITKSGFPETN